MLLPLELSRPCCLNWQRMFVLLPEQSLRFMLLHIELPLVLCGCCRYRHKLLIEQFLDRPSFLLRLLVLELAPWFFNWQSISELRNGRLILLLLLQELLLGSSLILHCVSHLFVEQFAEPVPVQFIESLVWQLSVAF